MLQRNAISEKTLALLSDLMAAKELNDFKLAGGTALAVQLGHRLSIDLDFFIDKPLDERSLRVFLDQKYQIQIASISSNSISGLVSGVKVDFIAHQYKQLNESVVMEGIRIYSLQDIAAMKINALCNRGSKKDFYDVYSLMKSYSIEQMFSLFAQKYNQTDNIMVAKSLLYFEDAELEPDPKLIGENASWPEVKKTIAVNVKKMMGK